MPGRWRHRTMRAADGIDPGDTSVTNGTATPSDHVAAIWVPASIDGSVVARRTVVRIADHGTGTGAELASALDASSSVDLAGFPPAPDLDPIDISVHPFDHPEGVLLRGPWDGDGSPVRRVVLADRVLGRLTRMHLDAGVGSVHLHAGAVVDDRGSAVILLGSSGAGKSTAVAYLVEAGLGLITDEQVEVLDAQLVGGFTRPVAIKMQGLAFAPALVRARVEQDADASGGRASTAGIETVLVSPTWLGGRHRLVGRPRLLVALERADGVDGTSITAVEPAAAFELLCANNLDLLRDPASSLAVLAQLAATIPTVRLRYGDSPSGAGGVLDGLARPPAFAEVAWSVSGGDDAGDDRTDQPVDGMPAILGPTHRRSADVLTVDVGGHVLLFHCTTRELVRLNEQAASVWRSLPAGLDVAQATHRRLAGFFTAHRLVSEHREPPGR